MRVMVVLSGGMDSATLLGLSVHTFGSDNVGAVSIDYGQRHGRELGSARRLAQWWDVAYQSVYLGGLGEHLGGSALTDAAVEVPDGHYADESMKLTVVPNRNMILLAVAAGVAAAAGYEAIGYAAHAGDHPIYPDCRPEFGDAMGKALRLGCDVKLLRPFMGLTKTDVCRLGYRLGVPYDITWSCYKGLEVHCGTCGTCVERREAFRDAGVPDPTKYAP